MMDTRYAFCVDSDGCAMDTMTYKHQLYFGPLAADVFGVANREAFLKEWDRINLFSRTRGVNRFVGLVMALDFAGVSGIEQLRQWVATTPSLSNAALEATLAQHPSDDLTLALEWSQRVNQGIQSYPGDAQAFPGVRDGLATLKTLGTVYVVSSANKEAVETEWIEQGLMPSVDDLYCQDRGKKEDAIADLLAQGYRSEHILMIGDSPGDLVAAEHNGVAFYPILVGHEQASWQRLTEVVAPDFVAHGLADIAQSRLKDEFWNNLTD